MFGGRLAVGAPKKAVRGPVTSGVAPKRLKSQLSRAAASPVRPPPKRNAQERQATDAGVERRTKAAPPARVPTALRKLGEQRLEAILPDAVLEVAWWRDAKNWQTRLRALAGRRDKAVLFVSASGVGSLAVGVKTKGYEVGHKAAFETFFENPSRSLNLLGARPARLEAAGGKAVYLIPVGSAQGGFEAIFEEIDERDTALAAPTLAGLLSDMARVAEAAREAASAAETAGADAVAAAGLAREAMDGARSAAAEANTTGRTVRTAAAEAEAAGAELQEVIDVSKRTIEGWRERIFSAMGPK